MSYDSVSYTEFSKHPEAYLDKIGKGGQVIVTRRKGKPLVIRPMDETDYLLSSPANAKALRSALKESPKKRKRYKSADDIRKEFGIK